MSQPYPQYILIDVSARSLFSLVAKACSNIGYPLLNEWWLPFCIMIKEGEGYDMLEKLECSKLDFRML